MSSTLTKNRSPFHTVVPTVDKFPTAIMVFGSLLLLINLFFLANFLFNLQGVFPGLGTGGTVQQLKYMLAARQLGVAVVFAIALFGKNVRFLQFAFFIAFIREVGDFVGALGLSGDNSGAVFVIAIIVIEIAAFIYLGLIASGRIPKYVSGAGRTQ